MDTTEQQDDRQAEERSAAIAADTCVESALIDPLKPEHVGTAPALPPCRAPQIAKLVSLLHPVGVGLLAMLCAALLVGLSAAGDGLGRDCLPLIAVMGLLACVVLAVGVGLGMQIDRVAIVRSGPVWRFGVVLMSVWAVGGAMTVALGWLLAGSGSPRILGWVFVPVAAWTVYVQLFGRRWMTIPMLFLVGSGVWLCSWARPVSELPGDDQALVAPAGPNTMRLMTWNLGAPPPFGGASAAGDLPQIADTIRDSRADVVCLQELAGGEHLDSLMKLLGPEWIGVTGVVWSKSTAVLTTRKAHFVQPFPDSAFGGPTIATLRTPAGPVDVISCHAAPGRQARYRRELADRLIDHIRRSGRPTLLAGDFNIHPERAEWVLASEFSDNRKQDEQVYADLTAVAPDAASTAGPTSLLGRRIDWVLATAQLQPTAAVVLQGKRVGLMDHKPVIVDFQLPRAAR